MKNAKKDNAPRGVFRQGKAWAIRFTCALGHVHEETVGPVKGDAIRAHSARRARALAEPGWCPRVERAGERARAAVAAAGRVTFREYADDYAKWAVDNKRSARKEKYLVDRLVSELGGRVLASITTADVERTRDLLLAEGRMGATVNRYRDLLSAMFKRAVRLGLVPANPVKGIPKFRETGRRIAYLPPARPSHAAAEEGAVRDALPERLRPAFTVSVHTGMRWSEQAGLRWRHVDVLANIVTVEMAKNGLGRGVPMNSTVRGALVDLASRRTRPDDADERVFPLSHRQTAILFARAVERAQGALKDAGKDASRLDGYTWHCNRQPHVRQPARDGRRGSPDGAGAGRLADAGDGDAVRAPFAGAPTRRGGAHRRADGGRCGSRRSCRSWT
jgi:integrase